MAFMVRPDKTKCEELGCPELAHIPVLYSSEWKLLIEPLDYLIARATGRWSYVGARSEYASSKKLSENTMNAYGRDLENFFTFCEQYSLDWRTVSYDQLLETYQTAMETGSYTAAGAALSAATINRRMGTVGNYLEYAAHHGLRDEFEVVQKLIPTSIQNKMMGKTGRRTANFSQRLGHVRQNPEDLRLPTGIEIQAWLERIKEHGKGNHGITRYLMCRTILDVGLRSAEVRLLRAEQIPDPNKLPVDQDNVMVTIMYGTKGDRKVGDPEYKGKPRRVKFKRDFLFLLHYYKRGARRAALEEFKKQNPGKPLPKQLFLSPSSGDYYAGRTLIDFWSQRGWAEADKNMPFKGWSPHLGRHAWACYEVLHILQKELDLIKIEEGLDDNYKPSFAKVQNLASTLIDMHIRPTMGHCSAETTEIYLRWLQGQVGKNEYARKWTAYLDGDDE